MKYLIIDNRMRDVEKSFFRNLGYKLIELHGANNVYPEISSHTDIFVCKINSSIFIEKSKFDVILSQISTAKADILERYD